MGSVIDASCDYRDQLEAEGINITDRIPVVIPPTVHDEGCLEVKREKMGHMVSDRGARPTPTRGTASPACPAGAPGSSR